MRKHKSITRMLLILAMLFGTFNSLKSVDAGFRDAHIYWYNISGGTDRVLYMNEDNDISNHIIANRDGVEFDEKGKRELYLKVDISCGDYPLTKKQEKAYESFHKKIVKNLKWKSSDESVIKLVKKASVKKTEDYNINDGTNNPEDNNDPGNYLTKISNGRLDEVKTSINTDESGNRTKEIDISIKLGNDERIIQVVGQGTAKITVSSPTLKKNECIYINVKKAGLYCPDTVYYTGNTYQTELRGGAKPVSYSSSNNAIAKVDENGLITTKQKTGKCVISCLTESGRKHNLKIEVQKAGLNYTRQTGYLEGGLNGGMVFPHGTVIVAKGIDVKKWKVSNKKIVKIRKTGGGNKIADVEPKKVGKCTITCEAKDGKTYKCQYEVKRIVSWGRGIAEKEYKNLFCYKNVNKILDYGDVIECISYNYEKKFQVRKGHKKVTALAFGERGLGDEIASLLDERFGGKREVYSTGGGSFINVPGHQLYYTVCYAE